MLREGSQAQTDRYVRFYLPEMPGVDTSTGQKAEEETARGRGLVFTGGKASIWEDEESSGEGW